MTTENIDPGLIQAETTKSSAHIKLSSIQAEIDSIPTDDSDYFDVKKYLPNGIEVILVEKGGALFIPHRINEFAIKVLKRKVTLLVFQCMLRYSLGFNRPTCKLSNNFIANWTGLLTPNVRKGLRELKAIGLVKIVKPGSFFAPTIYDVPIVRGFLDWKSHREVTLKQSEIKLIPSLGTARSEQSQGGDCVESPDRVSPIPKKENLNKKLKKTLPPLNELPSALRTYVLELRPHQKRVEEEYCLSQLLLDYRPQDIADALAFISKYGALDSGEQVHSPMKYLSYAAEQVIGESKRRREKLLRAEQLKNQIEQQQEFDRLKREREEAEFRAALETFESSLNEDQQNNVLNGFFQENLGASSAIPKNVVRRLAISEWYRRRSGNGL